MTTGAWRCKNCGIPRDDDAGGSPCPNCGTLGRVTDVNLQAVAHAEASLNVRVKRGDRSWTYIHMVLAIVLGIEGAVVFAFPGPWWARIICFLAIAVITSTVFLDSGRVHDLLVRIRRSYEDKSR